MGGESVEQKSFIITEVCGAMRVLDRRDHRLLVASRESAALIFTVRGRIRFTYEGGEVVSVPGSGVFLPQGLSYLNICEEEADSFLYTFQTLEKDLVPCSVFTPSKAVCEKRYEEMLRSGMQKNPYLTLSHLYTLASEAFSEDKTGSMTNNCVQYMLTHYEQSGLTLSDVAENAHISKAYLYKLFVREYGISPHRYLLKLRMEKARSLMLLHYPVSEVARNVGYMDIYQFSRAYKQFFGWPPSKEG